MTPEQPTVGYDQFMPQPRDRRLEIFNDVSPEDRAQLIQTHVKRWLAANSHRLSFEQISLVEEIIRFISADKYSEGRDIERIHVEMEGLRKRAEELLSLEDIIQIMSNRAEYVPSTAG